MLIYVILACKIIVSSLPRFGFSSSTDICMHLFFLMKAYTRHCSADLFMVILLVWSVFEVFRVRSCQNLLHTVSPRFSLHQWIFSMYYFLNLSLIFKSICLTVYSFLLLVICLGFIASVGSLTLIVDAFSPSCGRCNLASPI